VGAGEIIECNGLEAIAAGSLTGRALKCQPSHHFVLIVLAETIYGPEGLATG
jgi:hypothetical protein